MLLIYFKLCKEIMMNKKLVVLGNGPSLKGFDFGVLNNKADSIGMNAAYRLWERINWYPTHYVCLDDQLIETHAEAIYDMIVNKKIKTAFLLAKILDFYPDLVKEDNVFYLESFHGMRQKRVANKGVSYINSKFFKEGSVSSKVTTGSYAIRYGAFLGYKDITILGIDLKYVEIIPEASQMEGIKLAITQTPKKNPNYFFDDYQRKGDKYNIPNPTSHGCNLHVTAFEYLSHDISTFNWNINVLNSNRKSVLFEESILPFVDLKSFLIDRKLGAIIVPTTIGEIDKIENNLTLWDSALFSPSLRFWEEEIKPDLIFVFSSKKNLNVSDKMKDIFLRKKSLRKFFKKINVLFLEMDASLDYYEKNYAKKISGNGYKSGPNEQFFKTMNIFSGYSGFVFYMESDCLPIRAGWLDRVYDIAASDEYSWVVGSYYRGCEKIDNRFARHLNGNALYKVGDHEFINFVNKFWKFNLDNIIKKRDKRLAYDCLISYIFSDIEPSAESGVGKELWEIFQIVGHRFRSIDLIQNISGKADGLLDTRAILRNILHNNKNTFFVHGVQFQNLIYMSINNGLKNLTWKDILNELKNEEFNTYNLNNTWYDIENSISNPLPRVLIIDIIPIHYSSATGQIKSTFFENFTSEEYMQIWRSGKCDKDTFHIIRNGQNYIDSQNNSFYKSEILDIINDFNPEIIYFRPTDSYEILKIAYEILAEKNLSAVIHIMDDWMARLKNLRPQEFAPINNLLEKVIDMCEVKLAISQSMKEMLEVEYGNEWLVLANGVDCLNSAYKSWQSNSLVSNKSPFIVRYMGGLEDDMNYSSIKEIAKVISSLNKKIPIKFEIYTMNWHIEKARKDFKDNLAVSVNKLVSKDDYGLLLSSSDLLVIAYNFDKNSVLYTKHSLANKMPEYLITGVPVLAYGSPEVETIKYLNKNNCAIIVDRQDENILEKAISDLVLTEEKGRTVGLKGRDFAIKNLDKRKMQLLFIQYLKLSINKWRGDSKFLNYLLCDQKNKLLDSTTLLMPNKSLAVVDNCSYNLSFDLHNDFSKISQNEWRFVNTGSKNVYWTSFFRVHKTLIAGHLTCKVMLKSSADVKLNISLARYGKERYEGVSKNISLATNIFQTIDLECLFVEAHSAFKVQIEILELIAQDMVLNIEYIQVFQKESEFMVGEVSGSLAEANMLAKRGNFARAVSIYKNLYRKHKLDIYKFNAEFYLRKLNRL